MTRSPPPIKRKVDGSGVPKPCAPEKPFGMVAALPQAVSFDLDGVQEGDEVTSSVAKTKPQHAKFSAFS
jgi:hypothetical protein